MTVMKEMSASRPSSQHRISSSSTSSSLPRQSRTHSHSLSVGSINSTHRVTRRKSMSSTAANNVAAIAAAMKGASGATPEAGSLPKTRASKAAFTPRGPAATGYPSSPGSLPNAGTAFVPSSYGTAGTKMGSAVTEGPPLDSIPDHEKGNSKSRVRRASEGSHLSKNSKKTNGGDLRCETCGKGYKHSSCLTKHLWEHTPEWAFTSKLLISKHQQVQLLEAASVLVAMNQDGPDLIKADSDRTSASPAASGSSDPLDEEDSSSSRTTPPPHAEDSKGNSVHSKRYSSNSSAYSRSYQSSSVFSESAPNGNGHFSHYRQWSNDGRPTTSGTSVAGSYYGDEDHADLAAAVGLLSCSYGTPKSGPVTLPPDIPPVPPLPARYLGQVTDPSSESSATPKVTHTNNLGRSYSVQMQDSKDVNMDEEGSSMDEDDFDPNSNNHGGNEDEEEGVFGTMEE